MARLRFNKAGVGGDSTGTVRSAMIFTCCNNTIRLIWRLMPSNDVRVGVNASDLNQSESEAAAIQRRNLQQSRQCSGNTQCTCAMPFSQSNHVGTRTSDGAVQHVPTVAEAFSDTAKQHAQSDVAAQNMCERCGGARSSVLAAVLDARARVQRNLDLRCNKHWQKTTDDNNRKNRGEIDIR